MVSVAGPAEPKKVRLPTVSSVNCRRVLGVTEHERSPFRVNMGSSLISPIDGVDYTLVMGGKSAHGICGGGIAG